MSSHPIRISASRLKTLKDCSMKFYYENIALLPSDSHHKTRQGSCLHRLFELIMVPKRATLFRALVMEPDTAAIPEFIPRYILTYDRLHHIAPYEMSAMISMLRVAFAGIRPHFVNAAGEYSPPPQVYNEKRFRMELGSATISGVIDLLLVWPDRAVVLDIKTQKDKFVRKDLPDNIQACMYMLAVRAECGMTPNVDFILVRHPPTKRHPELHLQRTAALSTGALDGLAEYLKDMYGVINAFGIEDALLSPTSDVGFCERVCPFLRPYEYHAVVKRDAPNAVTPIKTYLLDKPLHDGYTLGADEIMVRRRHGGCLARWHQ